MHSNSQICFSFKFCKLFFLHLAAATDYMLLSSFLSNIIVCAMFVKMPLLNYQVDDYICVNAWLDNSKDVVGVMKLLCNALKSLLTYV